LGPWLHTYSIKQIFLLLEGNAKIYFHLKNRVLSIFQMYYFTVLPFRSNNICFITKLELPRSQYTLVLQVTWLLLHQSEAFISNDLVININTAHRSQVLVLIGFFQPLDSVITVNPLMLAINPLIWLIWLFTIFVKIKGC
jgi:hypothetical protein